MFYAPVVVHLPGRLARVACSIECARRHGYEPVRLAMHHERDDRCCLCGFEPSCITGKDDDER